MPQMMPMFWVFIFFLTLLIFFFIISLIYFIIFPSINSMDNSISKNLSSWSWKW